MVGLFMMDYILIMQLLWLLVRLVKQALDLMEITKNSLMVGIKSIKPGCHTGDIGSAIEQYVKPYKYGIVRELAGHGLAILSMTLMYLIMVNLVQGKF